MSFGPQVKLETTPVCCGVNVKELNLTKKAKIKKFTFVTAKRKPDLVSSWATAAWRTSEGSRETSAQTER